MPPRKRKHPHDAEIEPVKKQAPTRRPTRQHPDPSTEPEQQKPPKGRRIHANSTEKTSVTEVQRAVAKPAVVDPFVSTRKTRTKKRRVSDEPEEDDEKKEEVTEAAATAAEAEAEIVVSSLASKKPVQPPTPPDEAKRPSVVAELSPQPTKHNAQAGPNGSISKKKPRQSSPSATRPLVTRPSQKATRPTPAARGSRSTRKPKTIASTPKRNPPTKSQTPKPPATPRPDRNVDKIMFGHICFKAWYPSFYAKDILGDVSANVGGGNAKIGGGKRDSPMLDRLYICPCCFKYSKEIIPWLKHVEYCERKAFVPGTKVYTHPRQSKIVNIPQISPDPTGPPVTAKGRGKKKGDAGSLVVDEATANQGEWSIWEVDGEKETLFCQNLSLFAKLFLDNKSVFFDVSGFNYFLLVYTPPLSETLLEASSPRMTSAAEPHANPEITQPVPSNAHVSTSLLPSSPLHRPRPQIVGFFSKEKMSWDNNNLACILVFPPWQRKGLGALLMGVSYEISRREGLLGGPEKPISELGRKGYMRFWAGEIIRWILQLEPPGSCAAAPHDEKEKDNKGREEEEEILVVDAEMCSQATWIVPEDCLAVLREMGVIEEAGLGPPMSSKRVVGGEVDGRDQDKEKEKKVPRVKINRKAVRNRAQEHGIDLSRTCDPDGFLEGRYAVQRRLVSEEVVDG